MADREPTALDAPWSDFTESVEVTDAWQALTDAYGKKIPGSHSELLALRARNLGG